MTVTTCISIPIRKGDASQVGNARRRALMVADTLNFSELRRGQLGIVVTEAAGNIASHAGDGEVVICPWQHQETSGVDVIALDKGAGIPDIGRSMEDGYSTAGTAGQGLGAISRLSEEFQIYSNVNKGTALWARILGDTPESISAWTGYALGAVCVPIAGETECGDSWSAVHSADRSVYIVADGLGHGPAAAEASREAVRSFQESSHLSLSRILEDAHGALAKTRGAAVSVAEVLYEQRVVNYAGVGNIAGSLYTNGQTRSMVSMNGILGHSMGKVQQFSYPWQPNSALIMHSDGLGTRWNFDQYPGLGARHPALIAAVFYRDFSRTRDDVTILVSRI
jgi:anti-sigma regulatory factor (Ser/Thr protein kinase)